MRCAVIVLFFALSSLAAAAPAGSRTRNLSGHGNSMINVASPAGHTSTTHLSQITSLSVKSIQVRAVYIMYLVVRSTYHHGAGFFQDSPSQTQVISFPHTVPGGGPSPFTASQNPFTSSAGILPPPGLATPPARQVGTSKKRGKLAKGYIIAIIIVVVLVTLIIAILAVIWACQMRRRGQMKEGPSGSTYRT